jgi:C1A family cysteine protease
MRKIYILFVALIFLIFAIFITSSILERNDSVILSENIFTDNQDKLTKNVLEETSSCSGKGIGTANPSAVYCTELGYQYKVVKTKAGEYGVCIFPNKKECDSWDFLKGKCGKEYSYCAKNGYVTITKKDGKNPYSIEYSVCKDKGKELSDVITLMNLNPKIIKGYSTDGLSEPTEIRFLDEIEYTASAILLPSSFDWRNYNGRDFTTPVKDQGICGSCWAFAAVGAVEAAYDINSSNPNLNLDLSEEYLVSGCSSSGNCCQGDETQTLYFIRDYGVPDEQCMEYVDGFGCSCSGEPICENCNYDCSDKTCTDRCPDWENRIKKIKNATYANEYGRSLSNDKMKELMEKGPITIRMIVGIPGNNYWDNSSGVYIYRCSNDAQSQNHGVILVGYNDTGQYWIAKNSFGTNWENSTGGFFNLGYNECGSNRSITYVEMRPDNCQNVFNPDQNDSYPPQKNGVGDACECEGNFDGDLDVDGTDAALFKKDFGRSRMNRPCNSTNPCNGDFTCDGDVDGTDAAIFKQDFGRSAMNNPCPPRPTGAWCNYSLN